MQAEGSRRSLKDRQREERADLILQAAEEVLMEKGYHETSIDEIAARVGVAKGTVYLHFASKDDLVFALFERELETFLQMVGQTVTAAATARARLEIILQHFYKSVLGKRIQLLLTFYTSMDVRKGLLEKKEHLGAFFGQLSIYLTALLEEGKAAGEFEATIPTAVMLTTFFSLLSPQAYKHLVIDGQMPPEELVTYLGRIYFKGIGH